MIQLSVLHSEYYAGLTTRAAYERCTYVHVVTPILKVGQPYAARVEADDLFCCSDK
jgi:hypothetical protein